MTVIDRGNVQLEGECRKCGKCCSELALVMSDGLPVHDIQTFRKLKRNNPGYSGFRPIYRGEWVTNLVFRCNKLTSDNRCSDYANRPQVCVDFPTGGTLHSGCGYKVCSNQGFDRLLNQATEKQSWQGRIKGGIRIGIHHLLEATLFVAPGFRFSWQTFAKRWIPPGVAILSLLGLWWWSLAV